MFRDWLKTGGLTGGLKVADLVDQQGFRTLSLDRASTELVTFAHQPDQSDIVILLVEIDTYTARVIRDGSFILAHIDEAVTCQIVKRAGTLTDLLTSGIFTSV